MLETLPAPSETEADLRPVILSMRHITKRFPGWLRSTT